MKASRFLCRFLLCHRLLLFLFLFLFMLQAVSSAGANEQAEGPHLQIESVYGNLEIDRPSSIFVVLQNNASPSEEPDPLLLLGLHKANASSIVAELSSSDDRIKILSGPQMVGLLAAGENATVQFMAHAEGVPMGIYPLQLHLNYSRLSGVTASGEESLPYFVFSYETVSMDLPLQAKVVFGPKIEVEELKGEAAPGRESNLELILVNRGDEPALELQMQARPNPPFLMVENGNEQQDIAPEESAELSLTVFAEENLTSGYYALPGRITYQDGQDGERRSQDLALMVFVGEDASSSWLYLGAAGLALLLLAGGFFGLRRFMSGRRKIRIIRS
jgi:hypothetical protein